MTKAARRIVEQHNREVRRRNLARAKACFKEPSKPQKRKRRTSAEVQRDKERADAAWAKILHDRERIPVNSRNQKLPRLCPRW